jgi:hypothetical protein
MFQNNSQYLVLVIYVPIVTAMMVSMLTLTALALHKYMHILYPYVYIRLTTEHFKKSFLIAVLVIWTVAVLVCILPVVVYIYPCRFIVCKCRHEEKFDCMLHRVFRFDYFLVFSVVCALCGLVILISYVRIYMLAQREYKQIVASQSCMRGNRGSIERRRTVSMPILEELEGLNEFRNNRNSIEVNPVGTSKNN